MQVYDKTLSGSLIGSKDNNRSFSTCWIDIHLACTHGHSTSIGWNQCTFIARLMNNELLGIALGTGSRNMGSNPAVPALSTNKDL